MRSLSLVMSESSVSGRGQGHVSNFYIVHLENFATASRRYTGDIHNSVRSRFLYDTYRTVEATRSCHGGVHMFITHCPTVTLLIYVFYSFSIIAHFYRATLRIRCTNRRPVSVSVSVSDRHKSEFYKNG